MIRSPQDLNVIATKMVLLFQSNLNMDRKLSRNVLNALKLIHGNLIPQFVSPDFNTRTLNQMLDYKNSWGFKILCFGFSSRRCGKKKTIGRNENSQPISLRLTSLPDKPPFTCATPWRVLLTSKQCRICPSELASSKFLIHIFSLLVFASSSDFLTARKPPSLFRIASYRFRVN